MHGAVANGVSVGAAAGITLGVNVGEQDGAAAVGALQNIEGESLGILCGATVGGRIGDVLSADDGDVVGGMQKPQVKSHEPCSSCPGA